MRLRVGTSANLLALRGCSWALLRAPRPPRKPQGPRSLGSATDPSIYKSPPPKKPLAGLDYSNAGDHAFSREGALMRGMEIEVLTQSGLGDVDQLWAATTKS